MYSIYRCEGILGNYAVCRYWWWRGCHDLWCRALVSAQLALLHGQGGYTSRFVTEDQTSCLLQPCKQLLPTLYGQKVTSKFLVKVRHLQPGCAVCGDGQWLHLCMAPCRDQGALELETILREVFTITEKTPNRTRIGPSPCNQLEKLEAAKSAWFACSWSLLKLRCRCIIES